MSEMVVPDGWKMCKLGDALKYIVGGGTPQKTMEKYWNGTIPWATVKDLTAKNLRSTEDRITLEGLENSSSKLIPADTVIIATRMAVGRSARFNIDVAINQDLKALIPSNDLNNLFLHQWFLWQEKNLASIGTGSTVKGIRLEHLKGLLFCLPKLQEQQKIASILTSVDKVIEKTQAQIKKLQDLKKATMNELLTKGIGHTEFKGSAVGRIPKGWKITSVESIAQFVTSGSRGWAKYYSNDGAVFLRIGNLTRLHNNFRLNDLVFVKLPESVEGKRTRIKNGDILVSITADLGMIGVADHHFKEAYVNQHIALIRLKKSKVLPHWVGFYLAGNTAQIDLQSSNDSGTKSGLNLSTIRKTLIPIPNITEQEQISTALSSIDKTIETKQHKLNQTQALKKSLMQDLLTGKVRVNAA